jgi:hypothetical protein
MTLPDDPIETLRAANPHPTEPLPPAVTARLWARIEERTRPAPRRRWSFAVAGLATATAVLALVVVMGRPAGSDPSLPLGDGAATCLEVYSPETLVHRQFAFDGTVTAITDAPDLDFGSEVTFDVSQAFIGDIGESTTVVASGMGTEGGDSEGGPAINVGDRLLISGDDGAAWTCGFSRTYSAEMAAEWEAATR